MTKTDLTDYQKTNKQESACLSDLEEVVCADLPLGCRYCINGEKLVLFISGICGENCFYCPLSENRKSKDVIYANEKKINSVEEAIEEAYLCNSKGVGITGGNPLLKIGRTVEYLKALKEEFGEEFHSHLYTTPEVVNEEKLKMLKEAGLDEIRLHPTKFFKNDGKFKFELEEFLDRLKLCMKYIPDVGVEIPGIPGMEEEILNLANEVDKIGVKFLNINELEYSETNYTELLNKGFKEKNDYASGISGSGETAKYVIENFKGNMIIHYCPSSLKDGIQLKNRLINRAKNVAKEYDVITEEGLILRGIIIFRDRAEVEEVLEILEYNDVDFEIDGDKIFLNPSVLEDLIENLKNANYEISFSAYVSEIYPTSDKLEVERIPLITRKPKLKLKKN